MGYVHFFIAGTVYDADSKKGSKNFSNRNLPKYLKGLKIV